MRRAFVFLAFVCAFSIDAQQLRLCRPNDIPCDPPATFTYSSAPVPFNAPMRFSSIVRVVVSE